MQLNGALLAIGGLVLVLGLWSGAIRQRAFSEPLIALVCGVVLGPEVLGVLDVQRWGPPEVILREATRFTLAISLMAVALRVPHRELVENARTVASVLALGMPAMWLMSSALVLLVLQVPPPLAALVAAAMTPTDPVVASAIVTGKVAESNLPTRIRHVLSAESGANDGLALPIVALTVLWVKGELSGGWGHWLLKSVLLEVGGAVVFGLALGFVAGRLLDWALRRDEIESTSRIGFTLALSLTALGGASLLYLNEVLAVFVTGLTFDKVVSERCRSEEGGVQEAMNRFFMLPVFVLLGLVLPWREWGELGARGVLLVFLVLLLRRLPVLLALKPLLPRVEDRTDALYLGWFGPIGVAALYYAIHVKERTGEVLPWAAVTLAIVSSVLVHGVSATPLTRLYGSRKGRAEVAQDQGEVGSG